MQECSLYGMCAEKQSNSVLAVPAHDHSNMQDPTADTNCNSFQGVGVPVFSLCSKTYLFSCGISKQWFGGKSSMILYTCATKHFQNNP